jgi:predicted ferric reductase
MARVPLLERAFGQDRLVAVHRLVGFTSINLMLLHVVTISWGYAGGQLPAALSTGWNLVLTYPGMLIAGVGSALLLVVAFSSARRARRRTKYEAWHLLHLYAYLGTGLALPHQLWTGHELTGSPGRTLFWWMLWAVALTAVLVWRVAAPLMLNARHRLVVDSVRRESANVWSVVITGRRLAAFHVEPGQFLTWRFLTGPNPLRAHPYSLSAAPDGQRLRITVEQVGDDSRGISRLRPGTRVFVEGPYGRLTARARTRRRLAFLGAGVGVTPLRALAEGLDYAHGDAIWIERFRTTPLFASETASLARTRGLQTLRVGGRRRHEGSWLGTCKAPRDDLEALRSWIPDVVERDVYVCGPPAWTRLVVTTLKAAGLPANQIHLETFGW